VQQFTSLITVSIAAQLATFPISIYYFHQFPNYFLLTNLVAIPLSTGIIYLGIALMTCAGNHFLLHHLSTFFSAAVKFLNTCIRWISELPYSITDGIYIGTFELWGMYLSVIFLMLFLYKKGIHYLKFFLWSIIAILCIQFIQMIQLQNQRKLNVYALSKASAVDLIDGMKHVVVIDSANEKAMAGINELHPYWESLKLNAPLYATTSLQTSSVCVRDEAIQFYDKQIVILKSMEKTTHLFNKNCYLKVDYVILSNNVKLSIDEIIKIYQPGCIIFDSSSRNYFLKKWRDECEACHQKYYNLNDEGAFLSEF
jgi:competence protein ComEC